MNPGYHRVDRLPFASMHEADRHFLARLRSASTRELRALRVRLVREEAPRWQVVAVARAIAAASSHSSKTVGLSEVKS